MNYYWGKPNSSIIFCEEKYDTISWIAEYYNTISSALFIFAGLPFIFGKARYVARAFICMGVGSMIFHGTLQHYGQQADEIAMIVFNFFAIKFFCKTYPYYILVLLLSIYYQNSHNFLVFFCIFSLMQYVLLIKVKQSLLKIRPINIKISQFLFLAAFICWVADHILCNYAQRYQLHAWWHIFSALNFCYSMYIMTSSTNNK